MQPAGWREARLDLTPGMAGCRPPHGTAASALQATGGRTAGGWRRVLVWSRAPGLVPSAHSHQRVPRLPWASGAGNTWVKGRGWRLVRAFPWRTDRPPLAGQVGDSGGFLRALPAEQLTPWRPWSCVL